jgi:stringent starvation protein B
MAAAPTPRRPYLVRAMHEWMTANNQTRTSSSTPQLRREVPRAYVRDGRITLNVSWQATQGLKLGNEWIEFSARFGGVAQHVRIPVSSVLGIYAARDRTGHALPGRGRNATAGGRLRQPLQPRPKLRVIKIRSRDVHLEPLRSRAGSRRRLRRNLRVCSRTRHIARDARVGKG